MPIGTFSALSERLANLSKDVETINNDTIPRLEQKLSYLQKTLIGLLVTVVGIAITALFTVLVGLGRI
jgi:tetrahydromethanopterin S-methyltransferase subunit G